MDAKRFMFVLLAGALFGAGLALSTMIRPEIVLGFLRFEDFGLLLVLGGAMAVTFVAYRCVPRIRARALDGSPFGVHPSVLDRRTIGGAALFGIGWGIAGVCPAPAIAGLGAQNWPLAVALVGMFLGAYVQGRFFGGRG